MAFAKCFRENMEAMGLPAPQSLFGTVTAATATIGAIASAVKTYGTTVTLAEIAGAGIVSGAVAAGIAEVAGAVAASFYLGACVGSLIACTFDWATMRITKRTPLAISQIRTYLNHKEVILPEAMEDMLTANPEMRGSRVAENYEARRWYYMYGIGEGETALA